MILQPNAAWHYTSLAQHVLDDRVQAVNGFRDVRATFAGGAWIMLLVPDRGPAEVFVSPDQLHVFDEKSDLSHAAAAARQYQNLARGNTHV